MLNLLIISLFAIIPHQSIGIVAITMSCEGLVNTLGMPIRLFRTPSDLAALNALANVFTIIAFFGVACAQLSSLGQIWHMPLTLTDLAQGVQKADHIVPAQYTHDLIASHYR